MGIKKTRIVVFAYCVLTAAIQENLRRLGTTLAELNVSPAMTYAAPGNLSLNCLSVVWEAFQIKKGLAKSALPFAGSDTRLDEDGLPFKEMVELFAGFNFLHSGKTIIICASARALQRFIECIAVGTMVPKTFRFEEGQWAELDVEGLAGITAVRYYGKEDRVSLTCHQSIVVPGGVGFYAPPVELTKKKS